ncbi:DUF1003 domain-containing protein [Microcoleus sp. FACHB-831]|nr:DUF1003 domain-containing protein [Microcoleus sp. FACHB-831]
MNQKKLLSNSAEPQTMKTSTPSLKELSNQQKLQSESKTQTRGQHLADLLAAKVGSWSFLTVQTTILAGWVGFNVMPGVPHWDEQPFILLNLVFSFASAYTAPIVLMSQNRQSDIEREKNEYDHEVNRQAAQNIELLHEKMDSLQAQQLKELTQIVKKQQHSLDEIKASVLPVLEKQQQSLKEIKVVDNKFPNGYSVYLPFNVERQAEDNIKDFQPLIRLEK